MAVPMKFAVAMLAVMAVAGCRMSGIDDNGPRLEEVRVLYNNEQRFMLDYGNVLQARFPNVSLRVIEMDRQGGNREMDALIRQEKPDLIVLAYPMYQAYARDGRLLDLETYIREDGFDVGALHDSVVDHLRLHDDDGPLYGLAPTYYSRGIFYNPAIFDELNLPEPRDRMTWDELLALATRVQEASQGKYRGLYLKRFSNDPSPLQLAQLIADTHGWTPIDAEKGAVRVNSDAYRAVFRQAIDAYRSGAVFGGEEDRFLTGEAAMRIEGYPYVKYLLDPNDNRLGIDWEVATEPVDPERPDQATSMRTDFIFAIPRHSDNPGTAWDLIQFLHSEHFARIKTRTFSFTGFSTLKGAYDDTGRRYDALASLVPAEKPVDGLNLTEEQWTILRDESAQALAGEKTIDRMLADSERRLLDTLGGRSP